MPELPEVEVLRRHLLPTVKGRRITAVHVNRERVIRPTSPTALRRKIGGARIQDLTRRGKFLLFHLRKDRRDAVLMGHLGMTGRMFVQPVRDPLPKHTAVHLELGAKRFVYEDPRYFGRFTLDLSSVEKLGPEPWDPGFTPEAFRLALRRSAQAIKVKLLDQSLVAGIGNIYASEALFRAGISPRKAARRLTKAETDCLYGTIREVLADAIDCGSTIPLDFAGGGRRDGLFYYGLPEGAADYYEERLQVYDCEAAPCPSCATPIRRIVQAARSTFFCPDCQR
jgi:formamidopyrimidine-DNA glycosylase